MEKPLIVTLYQWEQIAFSYAIWLGFLSVFFVSMLNLDKDSRKHKTYWVIGALSFTAPILYILMSWVVSRATRGTFDMPRPDTDLEIWLGCFVGGIVLAALWLRYAQQSWNITLEKFKKTTKLERNSKTDVRTIDNQSPKVALEFEPLQFVDLEKGIFFGLDENVQPVYIEMGDSTSAPHVEVVGTTGSGKGVAVCVMASQFLERGEAVFFFDPKDDEHAPHVLYDSAQRTGKPYHFINLNRPNGPQFNPFEGATEEEAFELFCAGFSLTEKGDASDFYGIADRREAGLTAKLMAANGLNIAQAYAARCEVLENKETGAEKFAGRLREMAETPSINSSAGAGVDLEKVIRDGGCVYIVGSMRNDIVKTVQRILLVRLIQLAERRDRIAGGLRPVCIVLDEVKYHLSRPSLEALGAARDKGVHLIIMHQSQGDLRDCPKDINPDAVVDAIVENCRVKLSYQLQNPDTAEWLAKMSGTIQCDDESRQVRRNIAQSETVLPERTIRQAERYFMDVNILMNLKNRVGVIFGLGLAKFVSIQPLVVKKDRQAITVNICAGAAAPTARDAIALD